LGLGESDRNGRLCHTEAVELLASRINAEMLHPERVMEKLDLHSRTELIKFALREGVIRVDE
jgi:hypothetical protein